MTYAIYNLDTGDWLADHAGRVFHFTNRVLAQLGAALAGEVVRAAYASRSILPALPLQPTPITTVKRLRLELRARAAPSFL